MNPFDITRPLKLNMKSYGKIDIPFQQVQFDDDDIDFFYINEVIKNISCSRKITGIKLCWANDNFETYGWYVHIYVEETNEEYVKRMAWIKKKEEEKIRRKESAKKGWIKRKKNQKKSQKQQKPIGSRDYMERYKDFYTIYGDDTFDE